MNDVRRGSSDGDIDQVMERWLGRMRASEQTVRPSTSFADSLESQLLSTAKGIQQQRKRANHGSRMWQVQFEHQRLSRFGNIAATMMLLLAIGVGALAYQRWPEPDSSSTVPAAFSGTPAVDGTANATPTGVVEYPSAQERMDGCTVDRRPAGYVDAMLADTTWEVSSSFPIEYQLYPMVAEYVIADNPEVDQRTVSELNDTLRQLWSCPVRDVQAFGSDSEFRSDGLDGYYYANYSDNFFRRQLTHASSNLKSDPYMLNQQLYVGAAKPVSITTAWDIDDYDVPRVVVYISGAESSYGDNPGQVVTFVKVGGRWQIDETARAALTDDVGLRPHLPTSGEVTTDMFIEDDRVAFGGVWSQSYIQQPKPVNFYSDGGVYLRIYNLGEQVHRFEVAELGIEISLIPGETTELWIVEQPGEYAYVVYGEKSDSTDTGVFTFLEPGTFPGRG